MPLPEEPVYTVDDIYALPDGVRAELIDGVMYDMAPPSRIHQRFSLALVRTIADYIDSQKGSCEVNTAPFAVFLNADKGTDYVEPDLTIVCDISKLDDKGCHGAPDWVIEIVSPGSRQMDYYIKTSLYLKSGVREYWIVDPKTERTTIYQYEKDEAPVIYPFSDDIPVGIYPGFTVNISKLPK